MIIDFHVHCFPDELAPKAIPILENNANIPAYLDGTVGSIKASMKNSDVDLSVVLPIATKPGQAQKLNDWSASIQGDDIVSFGSIHPELIAWKDELKRIKDLGLKGIKFHPEYQEFYVDEKVYVYEYAANLELIIIFHAGVDIGMPEPYHCTPDRLKNICKSLSGIRLVAAHMGGYQYWNEVESYIIGEDIYLDTSFGLGHMDDERFVRMINNHGYEKILFATDSPWCRQQEELEKIRMLGFDKKIE
jgi:uncharacterized protein